MTRTTALTVPATYRLRGDWPQHAVWFSDRPEDVDCRDLPHKATHSWLLDRLGT